MSRKAERESVILEAIHDGVEKNELMSRLIGTIYKESVAKSLNRAYRNLLKKGLITEEWKSTLRGYRIVIVTWVKNCTQKSEVIKFGNN